MAQPKLWEYLDALSHKKDASVLQDLDFQKEYKPYIVNRSLSYHQDSVLAANMMNERSGLSPEAQFSFYLSTLRPRKRISKWLKPTVSDDVHAIAEYYSCSVRHAVDLLSLHSPDQLTIIHSRLEKGGMKRSSKGPRHDATGQT